MHFASPLWLIALLPWAGVTLWLLWGRRRRTSVSFLDFWRGPALQKPAKRALQPPPIYLAFALLAMGLALVAAAQPRLAVERKDVGKTVTVIVDRGITMSATSGGVPRFQLAARKASDAISPMLSFSTPVELYTLPGGQPQPSDVGDWIGRLKGLSPTAVDTQASLEETVRNRLATTAGPIIIVSDRKLAFDDPRLIQFSGDVPYENVGILRLAVRETPAAQVMVRLRNDSDRHSVGLKVISGSRVVSRNVDLPPRGQERDYFIDIDHLEGTIEAALDVHDDQPADDRVWLLREGSSPKIEARAALSPQLQRIVDVFTRQRPSTEDSQTVAIVDADTGAAGQIPGVLLAAPMGPRAKGQAIAVKHDVTEKVDWSGFPADVQTAGEFPRGWTPLVSVGGRVIVAAQAEPIRKVWIGFDAPDWSSTTDFVVFWANVFTWAGQGQERFASYPLADFDGPWTPVALPAVDPLPAAGQWPGVYKNPEGILRAFHAPLAREKERKETAPDWRQRLEAVEGAGSGKQRGYDVTAVVLVIAIACLAGAMMTWKRRGAVLRSREMI